LRNIDAPEIFKPKSEDEKERGLQSKKALQQKILNKGITLTFPSKNIQSFTRYVATPFFDSENICDYMVNNNYLEKE